MPDLYFTELFSGVNGFLASALKNIAKNHVPLLVTIKDEAL